MPFRGSNRWPVLYCQEHHQLAAEPAILWQQLKNKVKPLHLLLHQAWKHLTAQLSGGTAGAGSTQVPDLLTELIGAQRDQTAAINRLIQVQTA
jgi:hypothetical protein